MSRQGAGGQAMTEMLIVFPVLLLTFIGAFELVLAYRAYVTFDAAVQEATRLASMNNGQAPAIRKGLIRGIAPLYTNSPAVTGVGRTRSMGLGFARATYEVDNHMEVRRLNPVPGAFSTRAFGETMTINDAPVTAIPNSHLIFRDARPVAGYSIQDANLLRLEVRWCYSIAGPLLARLFALFGNEAVTVADPAGDLDDFGELSGSRNSPLCVLGAAPPPAHGATEASDPRRRIGITFRTDGLARMQSPIIEDCNPDKPGNSEDCL